MESVIKHDIAYLDFLRGWSAIFVFFHHASILGGGPAFLAGDIGQEAVNAFMLASGFLIYFQCATSKAYDGLRSRMGITNFYIRRFFRIAPAYYLALIAALLLSHYLGDCRQVIAEVFPRTMSSLDRYYIDNYWQSFLLHVTFIFGLIPSYAFSTPLPDWSLGLEMQFYVLFPLLFLLYKKHFVYSSAFLLVVMFAFNVASKRLGLHYPMPSFLPLKFHNFSAGIALAYLLINKKSADRFYIVAIAMAFLLVGNRSLYIPSVFLFSWWFLCLDHAPTARLKTFIGVIFKHRSSKFLADISYSMYILHLILMLPFFAYVLNGQPLSFVKWMGASLVLLAVVLAVAFIVYRYVELAGINWGKSFLVSPEKKGGESIREAPTLD